MKSKLFLIPLIILLLVGCTNPYVKYYQDRTGGIDIMKSPRVIVPTGNPQLFRGGDPDVDYFRMLEDGFGLIGISSFNAGNNVNVNAALEQATKVHASVALIYSKYTHTLSGSVPWTMPDTQTSTTTLSGNVMGPGGTASYSGSAYSTTYGTRTTYIPYSVSRFDYFASYWIKLKPPVFGVNVQELSAELKQKIGSNKGVVVIAVVKGSPAFAADILRGDILKQIGNHEILDPKIFGEATSRYAGEKVTVKFLRDGKEFTKEILLRVHSDLTTIPQLTAPEKPITSTPIAPSSGTTKTFTWTFANIRSGPGYDYPIITTVRKGDKLIIMGQSGEWINVRLENGQQGWISSKVLE